MNYTLDNPPFSGENPIVFMDLALDEVSIGRVYIRLYRKVFPLGVENFVKIAEGKTFRVERKGEGQYKFIKETTRSYSECRFYQSLYGNYSQSGDIYTNDGTSAGTIYDDHPIPATFGDDYYPHEKKGMISLVPFRGDNGQLYFDSTFMILLQDKNPNNTDLYQQLDKDQIVIGQIYGGLEVVDRMNKAIFPFAGRQYPMTSIITSGGYRVQTSARTRPMTVREKARLLNK